MITSHESCYEKSRQGLRENGISTKGNEQCNIGKTYTTIEMLTTISYLYPEMSMENRICIYIVTAILNLRSMMVVKINDDDRDQ